MAYEDEKQRKRRRMMVETVQEIICSGKPSEHAREWFERKPYGKWGDKINGKN